MGDPGAAVLDYAGGDEGPFGGFEGGFDGGSGEVEEVGLLFLRVS